MCYVPLIKSDTIGPCVKVGDPYSPTSPYKLVSEIEDVFRPATDAEASLKDIRNMKVWAFAGPMSPHEVSGKLTPLFLVIKLFLHYVPYLNA